MDGPPGQVEIRECPIRASLGVLGRKWALLVLRDVGFGDEPRFTDILRSNDGLTPRVLSKRLKELTEEGLITRHEEGPNRVWYALTQQGEDALPILHAFSAYGARHHADEVFADGQPRGPEAVRSLVARG